jgi:predicted dehydrogenase
MTVRYGVVGCAGIGNTHAEAVNETPDAELVACCDLDEDAAETFTEDHGVDHQFTSATEMIESADVDAVSICTPSGTHADLTVECAEAGADILCEKPLDVTVERVNRMLEAADREGVTLAGVYQWRTFAASRFTRATIADGQLGDLVLGDTTVKWFRSQGYYDSAAWRGTRDMDGGVLMNQAPHQIDRLQWLGGGVESVTANVETLEREMESEDTAAILLRFENGALGTIEATTTTPAGRSNTSLDGTQGSIGLENDALTHYELADETGEIDHFGRDTETLDPDLSAYEFEYGEGHVGVVGDFVAAIRDGREPMVPAEEARQAIDINLAAYRSAKTGEEIDLEDIRQ